LQQRTISELSG